MLEGRHLFIHKLEPVVRAETGLEQFIRKAATARLSSVWIKIAVGNTPYKNVGQLLTEVVSGLDSKGVRVWGWTEPRTSTITIAENEAHTAAQIASEYSLDGIIMDAEKPEGGNYFQGGLEEASAYSNTLRALLNADNRGLGLCSHDIPQNFVGFPFTAFAQAAQVNCPQVYYGTSPSVQNRLDRAIKANTDIDLPFVPVGAAWIGDGGGCASASAVVERAQIFMQLVHQHHFPGYSFWHWGGAPSEFWPLLYDTPP